MAAGFCLVSQRAAVSALVLNFAEVRPPVGRAAADGKVTNLPNLLRVGWYGVPAGKARGSLTSQPASLHSSAA